MIRGRKTKLHAFILIEMPGAMFFDFGDKIRQRYMRCHPHEVAINRDPPMVSVKRPKGVLADFQGLSVLVRVEKGV